MKIRSILFYFILSLWTIAAGLLAIPLLATLRLKIIYKVGVVWAYISLKLLRILCNISYQVEGKNNIPQQQNFVVASKHSSAWETIFLLYYFRPASFVVKKELLRIPIYGWYLPLLGMIPISRKEGVKSLKTIIKLSKKRLAQGFNFIIFPEGSRTLEKTSIKAGIYSIHKQLKGTLVVPVSHNSGKFFGVKGAKTMKQGVITVKIMQPINLTEGNFDKQSYLKKIEDDINFCR